MSAWGCLPRGVSARGECLPRGLSTRGDLPGGVCLPACGIEGCGIEGCGREEGV